MQISLQELAYYKNALLHWASQFPYCLFLDNCLSEVDKYGEYECLVGVAGESARLIQNATALQSADNQWLLGVLGYELKNELEPTLMQQAQQELGVGNIAFFVPETLIKIKREHFEVQVEGKAIDWAEILSSKANIATNPSSFSFQFESNFSKSAYLETIKKLKEHIEEGDFYEINLSQRFLSNGKLMQPAHFFQRLIQVSPVPFAAFFRWQEVYVMGASPERFLQLKRGRLVAQPIKGTAKRGKTKQEDAILQQNLKNSEKEQAENIMIVDLMRNDLYKSAEVNSVKVAHLFEVQTFPTVHQLVSTIIAQKKPHISTWEILAHTFPPGSMTGAPKVMTMQMIDKYESVARGIYSGSMGYIEPSGNFDFNVVIRSVVYDAQKAQLSYHVGGAIVYDSEPEAEYEETLTKAAAIQKVLEMNEVIEKS